MPRFTLSINGQNRTVEVPADMPLVWVLRDSLGMTGTKFGCGVGVCGSCTVLQDRRAVRSCQIPVREAAGKKFTTIEGLSRDGSHPCQRAWIEEDAAQCGFCQAGMIMTTCGLLNQKPKPSDAEINAALDALACRCGSYPRVRKAVQRAVKTGGSR